MKKALFITILAVTAFHAQLTFAQDPLDGLWQGYDGEWKHVSQQLVALAEATPADKFAWRPAPGSVPPARSTCTSSMLTSIFSALPVPKCPPTCPRTRKRR